MRAGAILLSILLCVTASGPATTLAADSQSSLSSDYTGDAACREIKSALHALSASEHAEAFALDLVTRGGSTSIVQARLSDLLERSQDLRKLLRRVRNSPVASEAGVEQCTRMGFRALVTAEKLSSDVEEVLFGDDESSLADAPMVRAKGFAHRRSNADPP
jgi:hypothetical protein